MCFIYIIYSRELDSYYVGQTIDIKNRLLEHNKGIYPNAFSSRAKDWKLYVKIKCNSRNQAIRIETHIKKMKSRKYLGNLKKYPEIISRLKKKYN